MFSLRGYKNNQFQQELSNCIFLLDKLKSERQNDIRLKLLADLRNKISIITRLVLYFKNTS